MGGPNTEGLINPTEFPVESSDLDVEMIRSAGTSAKGLGTTLDSTTDAIQRTWSGLQECYRAPEQHNVYRIMLPATMAADDLKDRMTKAGTVTSTYADAVDEIKPKLAALETDATDFRELALKGHERFGYKPLTTSVGMAITTVPAWGYIHEEWYEHTPYVERNAELLGQYEQLMTELAEAADTCSTGLVALMSPAAARAFKAAVDKAEREAKESAEKNPQKPPAWGFPREEERNCAEQVGDGVTNVFWSTVYGAGGLAGYNPETGWGDGGLAKKSWLGALDSLGSLAMFGLPSQAGSLLVSAGVRNPVTTFLDNRTTTATRVLASFVGIDLAADDPLALWKKAPVQAGTETVINVGSIFLGGAGIGRGVLKGALATSRGARIANALVRTVEVRIPGGSWLLRNGARVYRFTNLDFSGLRGTKVPLSSQLPELPATPKRPVSTEVFPNEKPPATRTGGDGNGSGGGKTPVAPHPGSPDTPHSPHTPDRGETGTPVRPPRPKPDDWPESGPSMREPGRHSDAVREYTGPHSSRTMNSFVNDIDNLSPAQARRLLTEQGDSLPPWVRERVAQLADRPGGGPGLAGFDPEQLANTARHVDAMLDVIDNSPTHTGTVFGGKWVDNATVEALEPGAVYQPNSFFSASTSEKIARNFALDAEHAGQRSVVFKVNSRTGVTLEGISTSDEILFRPGTQFRVVSRRPLPTDGLSPIDRWLLGEDPLEITLEEIP